MVALFVEARRYVAWIYWTAIVMVSVFGTIAADVLHVGLGVPYTISTPFFMAALAAVFAVWYASEKTLSIHSIHTRRRELLLGHRAGHLRARHRRRWPFSATVGLGYLGWPCCTPSPSPSLPSCTGGAPSNAVAAFWTAYVSPAPARRLQPADWMALSHARGGLDLGLGPGRLSWTVAIIGFVGYLGPSRNSERGHRAPRVGHRPRGVARRGRSHSGGRPRIDGRAVVHVGFATDARAARPATPQQILGSCSDRQVDHPGCRPARCGPPPCPDGRPRPRR